MPKKEPLSENDEIEREAIYVDHEEHIATVVINNPKRHNAITAEMWRLLSEAFKALSADNSVRCIILRGAWEEYFSPGCDINQFATVRSNKELAIAYGHFMGEAFSAMEECRHPIVAQIHGVCVGAGLELASLCDLRICGESSTFGVPIKNLGLVMTYHELEFFMRLVGKNVALEILLEGRIMEADEAQRKGLVTRIVPDDLVSEEVAQAVRRIASGAPLVARWHKKFVRRLTTDPTPITASENDECFDCFNTEDFRAGCAAFLLQSRPTFNGK